MKIGDEVYVHGYVDEVRKDAVIIKNEGGYFGTVADEIMPSARPEYRLDEWCTDCMDEKLKPCPFCGGTAVSIQKIEPYLYRPVKNHSFRVVCWECDLFFGYDEDYGGIFDTEAEAIKAWNRRASDD